MAAHTDLADYLGSVPRTYALLAVSFLLLVHISKPVVMCCRAHPPRLWLHTVRNKLGGFSSWVRHATKGGPLSKEVHEHMAERRLKLANRMYSIGASCLGIIGIKMVINIATSSSRFMTAGLEFVFIFCYTASLVKKAFPHLLNTKSLGLWYSVYMFLLCVCVSPLVIYKEAIPLLNSTLMLTRLILGLSSLNLPLVIGWNVIFMLTSIGSYTFLETECAMMPYSSTFIASELLGACSICLFFHGVKEAMLRQVCHEIEARSARNDRSAAMSLLGAMSDAVVELDEDLNIVGECRPLSCMLLRSGSQSLAGTHFPRLLATEDDMSHLRRNISQGMTPAGALAHVFHLRMKDILGNRVSVEIFHVCKGNDNELAALAHIIGIRECGDGGDQAGALPGEDQNHRLPGNLLSLPPPSSVPEEMEETEARHVVMFDAITFDILEASRPVVSLLGRNPGDLTFDEWVRSKYRPRFLSHYQKAYNQWCSDGHENRRIEYKSLPLQIPLTGSQSIRFKVDCLITLSLREAPESIADEDCDNNCVCEAILSELRETKIVNRMFNDESISSQSSASSFEPISLGEMSSRSYGMFAGGMQGDAAPVTLNRYASLRLATGGQTSRPATVPL